MSDIGKTRVATRDGIVLVTPGWRLDRAAAHQRAHYAALLEKSRRWIEAQDFTNEFKRNYLAQRQVELDIDHERCLRELAEHLAEHLAHGARLPDEPLHR
jgi:hypothetical protein